MGYNTFKVSNVFARFYFRLYHATCATVYYKLNSPINVVSVRSGVFDLIAPCFHFISITRIYATENKIPIHAKMVNTINCDRYIKLKRIVEPSPGGVPPCHITPFTDT